METGVRCLFFPRAPVNCAMVHGSTRGEPGEEAYHKGNDLGGRTAYARKRFFSHKLSHDHTVDRIIKLLIKSSEQDREEEQEKLLPDDAFCNLVFCLLLVSMKNSPLSVFGICIIISVTEKSNIIQKRTLVRIRYLCNPKKKAKPKGGCEDDRQNLYRDRPEVILCIRGVRRAGDWTQ